MTTADPIEPEAKSRAGVAWAALSGLLAGFAFEESREALKDAGFLWDEPAGHGHVICFADDVTFRTFLYGAHRLFLNSILLPPSSRW